MLPKQENTQNKISVSTGQILALAMTAGDRHNSQSVKLRFELSPFSRLPAALKPVY